MYYMTGANVVIDLSKNGHNRRYRRKADYFKNRIDLAQVKVNEDVLELERDLGDGLEDVSRSVSCLGEEFA